MKKSLEKAIAVLGGIPAAMTLCEKKHGAIYGWIHTTGKCPAELVLLIERETFDLGTPVTRYELRPDIFGIGPTTQDRRCAKHANQTK